MGWVALIRRRGHRDPLDSSTVGKNLERGLEKGLERQVLPVPSRPPLLAPRPPCEFWPSGSIHSSMAPSHPTLSGQRRLRSLFRLQSGRRSGIRAVEARISAPERPVGTIACAPNNPLHLASACAGGRLRLPVRFAKRA